MELSLKTAHGVPFVSCDGFEQAGGVAHGFSTRLGGVSTGIRSSLNLGFNRGDDPDCVRENLRRFCAAAGTDPQSIIRSNQVHGDRIRPVTRMDLGADLFAPNPHEADGMITNEPGLCLTVFTADCIPVLLYDPAVRCIAAVHSGWRGTALAIASRAVEQMTLHYGCNPANLLAAVGPGICPSCFETHSDVPDAMTAALGRDAAPFLHRLDNGKYQVDLKGIIAHCLLRSGLQPEHIAVSDHCTACLPEYYWSHRLLGGQRGSMAAVIQLLQEK